MAFSYAVPKVLLCPTCLTILHGRPGLHRMQASSLHLRRKRRPVVDGRFVNRPYGPGTAGRCGHRPLRVPSPIGGMAVRAAFLAPIEPQRFSSLGGSCAAGAAALFASSARPNRALSAAKSCRLPEPHRRRAPGPGPAGPGCFFPGFFASKESRRRRPGLQKRKRIAASAPRGLLAMTGRPFFYFLGKTTEKTVPSSGPLCTEILAWCASAMRWAMARPRPKPPSPRPRALSTR